jgi:uncharacterized protein YsxB (DUF464 family)
MITVVMVLDEQGLLQSCDVQGHAGAGKRGNDIVCAAVSVLVRTAQSTLTGKKGITAKSKAKRRGVLTLKVTAESGAAQDFLAGISAFLVEGLLSVAMEYPDNCVVTITKERRK